MADCDKITIDGVTKDIKDNVARALIDALATVANTGDYGDLINKPTKVSDFANDAGFIDNTVNNLTNYYLKSETYTQAEVQALISAIVTLHIEVVQTLPTTGISRTTIYLVPKTTAQTSNVYDEYINLDGTSQGWEKIGDTEIDLSNYYTKSEADALIANKMDKVDPTGTGSFSLNRADNTPIGLCSTATGYYTQASGDRSHSEGTYTNASGDSSHAEGGVTSAIGTGSHAEGRFTKASGDSSHAEGVGTSAASDNQHVSGKYNIEDQNNTYAEIIGNGTNNNNRSNARTLDWNGNETIAGDLFCNGGNVGVSTLLGQKADASSLATVATSGDYNDLDNLPTIPAAQVNSDWNATGGVAQILNKPTFKTINGASVLGSGNITTPDTTPTDYNGQTSVTGTSVAHGTSWTELLTANITAGTWLVSWAANFASNGGTNTGYRGAGVATTGDPFAYMAAQVPAVTNNTYTLVSGCALHVATGNQTLKLKVRQYSTSGTSLTVTPRLQVIKIL